MRGMNPSLGKAQIGTSSTSGPDMCPVSLSTTNSSSFLRRRSSQHQGPPFVKYVHRVLQTPLHHMQCDVHQMSERIHHRRHRPKRKRVTLPQHLLQPRLEIARLKLLHALTHEQPSPADPFEPIAFYRSRAGMNFPRDERERFGGPYAFDLGRVNERTLEEACGLPGEWTGWEEETRGGVDGSPDDGIMDDREEEFGYLETGRGTSGRVVSDVECVLLADESNLEGQDIGGRGISSLLGERRSARVWYLSVEQNRRGETRRPCSNRVSSRREQPSPSLVARVYLLDPTISAR